MNEPLHSILGSVSRLEGQVENLTIPIRRRTKGPGLWLLWAAFKLANAFWEKILSQHCFNLVNLYARRGG